MQQILNQLGLSKNEAQVYEALLKIGEAGVKKISQEAQIHTRNTYDVLNRLLEKGLVFIVLKGKENHYQAVNPNKLMELVKEEKSALDSVLPDLKKLMKTKAASREVMIYKGFEGWKQYIRDIIRIGQDISTIGAKGSWTDERMRPTLDLFNREAQKRKMKVRLLFEWEVKEREKEIASKLKNCEYAFMPKKYSTTSEVDIFGNHLVVASNIKAGKIDDGTAFTVIINQQIADAFRVWFELMWRIISRSS